MLKRLIWSSGFVRSKLKHNTPLWFAAKINNNIFATKINTNTVSLSSDMTTDYEAGSDMDGWCLERVIHVFDFQHTRYFIYIQINPIV